MREPYRRVDRHRHVGALAACLVGLLWMTTAAAQGTGRIRGIVVDDEGFPVTQALVVVTRLGGDGATLETATGEDGRFEQTGVAAGLFAVSAGKEGLRGKLHRVRVRDGRVVRVDFVLEPGQRAVGWLSELSEREALSSVFEAGLEASRQRDFEEAIDLFTRTLTLSPTCRECAFNLAVAYADVGQLADAESAFTYVIDISPDYAAAHYGLASVYAQQGREAEAAQARAAANRLAVRRLDADRTRAEAAVDRGITLLDAGDVAGAQRQFRDALAQDIMFAPAHYWLGMSFVHTGLDAQAASEFRQYLRLAGDGPHAGQARAQLQELEP